MPESDHAAADVGRGRRPDTPAQAQGRRILSTAFVRIGAGGTLQVEQHDGTTIVLRDVVMGPRDYCGVRADGPAHGARFCGHYAQVAAARPGL